MKAKKQIRQRCKTVYDVDQKAFKDLIGTLKKCDLDKISKEAKVSRQTLENWIYKVTKSPRYITMCKVAKVLGMEAHWVQTTQVKKQANLRLVK